MPASLFRRLKISGLSLGRIALLMGLYAAVVLLPSVLVVFGAAWLRQRLSAFWWFVPVSLFGLLATAAPILYFALLRRMEARLMRDQRRYHRTLIAASSGMTRIKEIQHLCRLITHVVNRTVGLTNSSLFLYMPKEPRYILQAVRYPSLVPAGLVVEQHDPLVGLLQQEKDLVMIEELEEEMDAKPEDDGGRRPAWVYAWMRKLEANLIVPSFSNDRLLAFLVLGEKRSGKPYTTDDIAMFSGLANQAALAIENAMFFEELRTNEANMIQSEKLASLGQLASGMAHEILNPLTIISGEAQLYLERF